MNSGATGTQRLFFALWPGERVRGDIQAVAEGLSPQGGRRVSRDQWHVTLAFLGDVTAEQCACYERAAHAVSAPIFTLYLDRLGYWPRQRICWIGAREPAQALLDLVASLNRGLGDCGYAADSRPFKAHITLARKVARRPPAPEFKPVAWTCEDFCLVESRPGPEGSRYRVLRSWPLSLVPHTHAG